MHCCHCSAAHYIATAQQSDSFIYFWIYTMYPVSGTHSKRCRRGEAEMADRDGEAPDTTYSHWTPAISSITSATQPYCIPIQSNNTSSFLFLHDSINRPNTICALSITLKSQRPAPDCICNRWRYPLGQVIHNGRHGEEQPNQTTEMRPTRHTYCAGYKYS